MILLNTFESQQDERNVLFQLLKFPMVYGFDFDYFEVEDIPANVEILMYLMYLMFKLHLIFRVLRVETTEAHSNL